MWLRKSAYNCHLPENKIRIAHWSKRSFILTLARIDELKEAQEWNQHNE